MHIQPGLVEGAKLLLGAATAAGSLTLLARAAWADAAARGLPALALRAAVATASALVMFQVLPHPPVGVSEAHLILGATLFLTLGGAAAGIGLGLGLLLQGLLFAPFDLPQLGMNLTTLLAPLAALDALARRIAPDRAWIDLTSAEVARLSLAYQGGVVAWVAFWTLWATGSLAGVAVFALAYAPVVLIETAIDVGLLKAAQGWRGRSPALLSPRLLG